MYKENSNDIICQIKTNYNISEYNNIQSIESIRKEWNNIISESSMPNIFLTWEWITTWWKNFGNNTLRIFIIRDSSDRVVGVCPMYFGSVTLIPGLKIRSLIPIGFGGPLYPDYLGPVFNEKETDLIAEEFIKFIFKDNKYKHICLWDVLPESPASNAIIETSRVNNPIVFREGDRCPYFKLPDKYETFLQGLSRRRRESVRRKLKKVKEKFIIKFETVTDVQSIDEYFNILRDIFSRSLRGKNKNECFARKDYFCFHKDVAKVLAMNRWLRLFILYLDNVPVAFIYGYLYEGIFFYYQTAFDLRYSNIGAGVVILQLTIETLINEGAKEFDFLRGEEEYKFHYATHERRMKRIIIFRKKNIAYYTSSLYVKICKLCKNIEKVKSDIDVC